MAGTSTKAKRMLGAVLGIALFAGSVVGLQAHGASASAQFNLNPAPGAASYGGGAVGVTPLGGAYGVTVSLGGARPGATYQVSACINVGTLQCTNNGVADFITANVGGALGGSVVVPAPSRLDVITLTNVYDMRDQYQAVVGYVAAPSVVVPSGVVTYSAGYPYTGVTAVATPSGIVFVPYGTTIAPVSVCPVGYYGALGVVNGYYGYAYGAYYPYYLLNGLPVGLTTTVYCGIA